MSRTKVTLSKHLLNFVVDALAHGAAAGERGAEIVSFCTLLVRHYNRVTRHAAPVGVVVVTTRADDVTHVLSDQKVSAVRRLALQQRLVRRGFNFTYKSNKSLYNK